MAEKTVPTVQENQMENKKEMTREENRYITPPVDIFEHDNQLVVLVDLPGAHKENVHVNVENQILTIQAAVGRPEQRNAIYHEFELVNFFRQFELSDKVDVENITAEYKNGVMTIHLPKVPKAVPKQIKVKVA